MLRQSLVRKLLEYRVGATEAAVYFQNNFPCSMFRSDVDGQMNSEQNLGWSADDHSLKRNNKFLHNFAEALGNETARLVDMEDWTKDVSILNSLVSWLGFRGRRFENHDGYGRDNSDPGFGARCRYPHK